MALVACPECGHQVSSAANSCPHCGHPLAGAGTANVELTGKRWTKLKLSGCLLLLVGFVIPSTFAFLATAEGSEPPGLLLAFGGFALLAGADLLGWGFLGAWWHHR